jgi:hypothetical protein
LVLELDRKGERRVLHLLQRAVDQGFVEIENEGEAGARSGKKDKKIVKNLSSKSNF